MGVGTIDIRERNQRKTCLYRIRNKSHLKSIVLPIFDKYPMFSNKQYDYLMFKDLLLNELHFSKDLSNYVRPIDPLNSIDSILEKSHFKPWLIGFIEAEGCFSTYKPAKDDSKVASFDVSQKDGEVLLSSIGKYLSFTTPIYTDKFNCYKLKVTGVRSIENVIKFIQSEPVKFLGNKKLQYLLWLKELRRIDRYNKKIKIPSNY